MRRIAAVIFFLAAMAAPAVFAQTMQHGGQHAGGMPVETGQGAFAAIQEIVAILEADPDTDWSRVDLGALRLHLADMNALILYAEVAEKEIPGGLEIVVDGAGRAGDAARRMVPAHARELSRIAGWTAAGSVRESTIVLTVTASDANRTARIRGLGFFGLMASGAHHQPHHLAIARGYGMPH